MTTSGADDISRASIWLPTPSMRIFTFVASMKAERITLKQRSM